MTALSNDFRSAADWAKEAIQDARMDDGWDLATTAGWQAHQNELVGILVRYPSLWGLKSGPFLTDPTAFSRELATDAWNERAADFLARLRTDRRIFDAFILGLASVIEDGDEIHPKLRPFLADFLRGRISPPKSKAGRGHSEGLHLIIVAVVQAMVAAGWQPLRNDASPKQSACDVVALALAELGLSPITYSGVKRIWGGRYKEFPDFRRALREGAGVVQQST